MSERAVVDSTCLIGLESIGRLDLLPTMFHEVIAPAAVVSEFGSSPEWLMEREAGGAGLLSALLTQVDDGEAHAIALASELTDTVLVLDDKKARRVAKQMGLRVVGTVAVIVRAKRAGHLSAVRPVLDALDRVGFRLSQNVRQEALRLADEPAD